MRVNYQALTDPINPMSLKEFSRRPSISGALRYYGLFGAIIIGVFGIFLAGPLLGFVVFSLHLSHSFAPVLFIVAVAAAIVGGYFIGKLVSKQALQRMYRLSSFAEANGWLYNRQFRNPSHAGMIFGNGHSRYAEDQIYSTDGNLFEVGNYYYTVGSGKNSRTYSWGYVCIKLQRRVPNMVLDAKSNNSNILGFQMSNLPESLRGNATMSLEGDFNKYFTLYAPKEYERDALYVFTPELMAVLVDESAQFDVEVVDDRMYVYSSRKFDLTNVATLRAIFNVINQVGEEMIDNTDYYADERVGDRQANVVAAGGVRLKHSVPVFVIVVFIIVILFQVLPLFFGHH